MFIHLMDVFREWNKPVTLRNYGRPRLIIKVHGIDATIDEKENDYGLCYEVVVRPNGKNPEYPEAAKDLKVIFGQKKTGALYSVVDNKISIPEGHNFYTKLVVTEKSYVQPADRGDFVMGCFPTIPYPDHKILTVMAHVKLNEEDVTIEGPSLMVRKSQRESAAYQKAKTSPYYNMI